MIGSTSKITIISEKPCGINVVLIKAKWAGWDYWHQQAHLKLLIWRSHLTYVYLIKKSALVFLIPWY